VNRESTELVFVYGTLRRGASNAFRMDGAEWQGVRVVSGALYQVSWYPGVTLDPGAPPVLGELWSVSREKLRELDEFEGVPEGATEGDEYRRVRATVTLPPDLKSLPDWDGASDLPADCTAWIWEWKGDPASARLLPGGDWLELEAPPQKPVFTSIGCMAVLGFTVGLQYLLGLVGSWFLSGAVSHQVEAVAHLCGLVIAFASGAFCISMAIRRREPWHPFQILTGLALLYLLYVLLVALASWILV